LILNQKIRLRVGSERHKPTTCPSNENAIHASLPVKKAKLFCLPFAAMW
jgi:hypothetical protein